MSYANKIKEPTRETGAMKDEIDIPGINRNEIGSRALDVQFQKELLEEELGRFLFE